MTDETTPTITLDGASYAVTDLTQTARDTLQSIQFVEAKLRQLQGGACGVTDGPRCLCTFPQG